MGTSKITQSWNSNQDYFLKTILSRETCRMSMCPTDTENRTILNWDLCLFGISKKKFPKEVVWHFNSNLVPFVLISCNGRSSKCILCYCLSGPSAIKRVQDCKKWGTLSWENIKNIQGNLKPHTSKLNNTGRGLQKRGTFKCEKISKIL